MPLGTYLHGSATPGLRGILMLALSDTGTVQVAASTSDVGGGATQAWTAGAAVPCRIDPLGAGQGPVTGERLDERSTHVVTVPPRTTVNLADRFAITNRGTFEVTAVRQQTDEGATMFEVVAV
jgi:hypothetical protein